MNALSVVLTSLVSVLVVIIVVAVIVFVLLEKTLKHRVNDQEVLNKYAPNSPVVFLGDSLTDFYPIYEFFHDERIVNRGIANDTTEDVVKRLKHIIELRPKVVFLQIGINDYIHTTKKLGANVVFSRIKLIIEKLLTVSEVKVISLYPVNRKKHFFSPLILQHANNKTIIETNELLKNYCTEKDLTFIDAYPHLTDGFGKLDEDFTVEGLHLNCRGYEALTSVLKPYVDGTLKPFKVEK